MTDDRVIHYIYEINRLRRVIFIEDDGAEILHKIWKSELILKCSSPFQIFEIVDSDQPQAELATKVFDFLQREFSFNSPDDKTWKYQGPKIPEQLEQRDKFVSYCCQHTSYLLQLLVEICHGFPQTLLFGVHLPQSFFAIAPEENTFLHFLGFLSALRIDLYIFVSSNKPEAELEALIMSTCSAVEISETTKEIVQ